MCTEFEVDIGGFLNLETVAKYQVRLNAEVEVEESQNVPKHLQCKMIEKEKRMVYSEAFVQSHEGRTNLIEAS